MLNTLNISDKTLFDKYNKFLFPFRVEPNIFRHKLISIRIYAGIHTFRYSYEITKEALISALDYKEILRLVKKQISYELERVLNEKRYADIIKENQGTKNKYNIDTAMPIGKVIITVHPETYTKMLQVDKDIYNILKNR